MKKSIKALQDRGLCTIPVQPAGKAPLFGDWQKRTANDNNIDEFSGNVNVGVVLGEASGNKIDVDLDQQ